MARILDAAVYANPVTSFDIHGLWVLGDGRRGCRFWLLAGSTYLLAEGEGEGEGIGFEGSAVGVYDGFYGWLV